MSLLRQVVAEIYSMFAGDALMTLFAVLFVAIASALHFLTSVPSWTIGFALFAACVALLLARVYQYANHSGRHGATGSGVAFRSQAPVPPKGSPSDIPN